ncbi:MAG: hypothetical protein ABUT20_21205 [Bacteroidota bacterium]
MSKQIRIKILFIAVILAIACSCIQTSFSIAAAASPLPGNTTLTDQLKHIPNAELEGLHLPVVSGVHTAAQKNFVPFQLSIASHVHQLSSSENLQIQASSLLIRDYLSHIYPSHNFW